MFKTLITDLIHTGLCVDITGHTELNMDISLKIYAEFDFRVYFSQKQLWTFNRIVRRMNSDIDRRINAIEQLGAELYKTCPDTYHSLINYFKANYLLS